MSTCLFCINIKRVAHASFVLLLSFPHDSTPAVTTNRGDNIFVNKTGVYYVTKDGLTLLPSVAAPTKQQQKRNQTSVPHAELPHLVTGPLGPGGSGRMGDEFMAVSVPSSAPAVHPRNSFVVVDSAMESVKAQPPNAGIFKHLFTERRQQRERRNRRRLASSPLQGMLAKWASPVDIVDAFRDAYSEDEAEAKPKEYWPEYVYARRKDTNCFLCGLQPLPSSAHVNPDGDGTTFTRDSWLCALSFLRIAHPHTTHDTYTALDTEWWLGATTDAAPSLRRASASSSSSPVCAASDVCAQAATTYEALTRAEEAAPGPLELPPGVKTFVKGRRQHHHQRERRRRRHRRLQDDGTPLKLPDGSLLWKTLTVHCASPLRGCGLTEKAAKAALKTHVNRVGFAAGEDPSYKLTAANAGVPAAVLEAFDDEDGAWLASMAPRRLNDACPHAATFKVYVVTRDQATAKGVAAVLTSLASNSSALLDALATEAAPLCAAAMADGGAFFLPSIDTPQGISFYQKQQQALERDDQGRRLPVSEGLVWPNVALYSPHNVAPVGLVHSGKTYSIVLRGLDPSVDEVVVELVRGLQAQGEVIASTTAATTLTWTAPVRAAGEAASSRFFLYAHYKHVPGFFDLSCPFRWGSP